MSKWLDIICDRLAHIGVVPLCNGISERAPHLFGYCFPLCYRCLFIILFFFMSLYFFYLKHLKLNKYVVVLLMIPMIIDGCLQTFFGIESHNIRRMITGGMFGISLGYTISYLWIKIEAM